MYTVPCDRYTIGMTLRFQRISLQVQRQKIDSLLISLKRVTHSLPTIMTSAQNTVDVPTNENISELSAANGNERSRCRCSRRSNANQNSDGEGFVSRWMPRWKPTSAKSLEEAEQNILECLTTPYESRFVEIDGGEKRIRTLHLNPSNSTRTPYVLVHGFASAVGLWVLNLEALAAQRPVYAFDIMGFGRSSRPQFPLGAEEAEAEFVRSIEEWRKAVGIEEMILVGHSMGGFLSSSYSLRHPDRVKHLVLLDPWGYPHRTDDDRQQLPFWARVIGTIVLSFNPLSSLRAAGPLGPWLVRKTRGDIGRKFSSLFEDDRISQYIYHCNAQYPSGERGFKDMSSQVGWAVNPMIDRITDLPSHIPMSLVYGSRTWMDITSGTSVKYLRKNCRVDIRIIKGAGHHVYADKSPLFNETLNSLCENTQ